MKKIFIFFILNLPFLFSFSQLPFGYDKYLEELKNKNPTLYNFEKRLKDIQKEIQRLIKDYQEGEVSKGDLKDKLKPLIKEEIEIIDNPEYRVEQRLEGILRTLPSQKTKSTPPIKIEISPEK
ncbi:MAG: hypothetical protein DRP61_04960 [Candidatus Omnitrophota bacterium]|nr:MAG: hypothetical protein DRP61_04960 [Candidatus Omnitrophota bacterium]